MGQVRIRRSARSISSARTWLCWLHMHGAFRQCPRSGRLHTARSKHVLKRWVLLPRGICRRCRGARRCPSGSRREGRRPSLSLRVAERRGRRLWRDVEDRAVPSLSARSCLEKYWSAFLVLVCCSPVRSTPRWVRNAGFRRRPGTPPTARIWSTAPGSWSCPGRTTARRRVDGRILRRELQFEHGDQPRIDSSSSASPSGACAAYNARCSLE